MPEIFFSWQGIIHYTFIPEWAVVNKERYKKLFIHVWEEILLKWSKMWAAKDWMLLFGSALSQW